VQGFKRTRAFLQVNRKLEWASAISRGSWSARVIFSRILDPRYWLYTAVSTHCFVYISAHFIIFKDGKDKENIFTNSTCRWEGVERKLRTAAMTKDAIVSSFIHVRLCRMHHNKVTSLWRSFWYPMRRWHAITLSHISSAVQLGVVIHELIAVKLWKDKVFSLLSEDGGQKPKSTFPCYVVVSDVCVQIDIISMFYMSSSFIMLFVVKKNWTLLH